MEARRHDLANSMIGLGGKHFLLHISLVVSLFVGPGGAQLFFDRIDGLGLVPPPRLRDDLVWLLPLGRTGGGSHSLFQLHSQLEETFHR